MPNLRAGSPRPTTASQNVYRSLRGLILKGELEADQPLRQDELAARFGTSRLPVREALRQLESENLITYHPRRGAVVTPVRLADALELYDIRIGLECRAMELAVHNLSSGEISALQANIDATASSDDVEQLEALNRDFHLGLYRPADRPRLLRMIESTYEAQDRFVRLSILSVLATPETLEDHRKILAACRARDSAAALSHLHKHLFESQRALAAAYRDSV